MGVEVPYSYVIGTGALCSHSLGGRQLCRAAMCTWLLGRMEEGLLLDRRLPACVPAWHCVFLSNRTDASMPLCPCLPLAALAVGLGAYT